MKLLQGNDAQYKRQFSQYMKHNVGPDALEALYKKVHANIRANPDHQKKKKKHTGPSTKNYKRARMTHSQRKDRVRQKVVSQKKRMLKEQEN